MNCDTVNSCSTKEEMKHMVDEVVCEGEDEQAVKQMLRTTQRYWEMQAKRVELEQDEAPARRKRNDEEN
jgi:hypothetical protein